MTKDANNKALAAKYIDFSYDVHSVLEQGFTSETGHQGSESLTQVSKKPMIKFTSSAPKAWSQTRVPNVALQLLRFIVFESVLKTLKAFLENSRKVDLVATVTGQRHLMFQGREEVFPKRQTRIEALLQEYPFTFLRF